MDTHQITDLVASVSALMERFERRTQQIESGLQARIGSSRTSRDNCLKRSAGLPTRK